MGNELPRNLKLQIWERDNYICVYCNGKVNDYNQDGGRLPDDAATIDHIKPKSKGGSDLPENVVTSCYLCNNILGDCYDTLEDKVHFISRVRVFLTSMELKGVEIVVPDMPNPKTKKKQKQRKAYWNKRQKQLHIKSRRKIDNGVTI